ncbi:hypothetical protein DPMN_048223 [Dreissena polymorpha]|uniref:Uncharacterized protein n=1 Tax=Dreissena polymorpha TaxID=45954 RepID=A0A9D4DCY4_DREPO|nr:hypothetical protein DPMN_048223 [Dreissena polymorpha]
MLYLLGACKFVACNGNLAGCEPSTEEMTCAIVGVACECSRDPAIDCSVVWTLNGKDFTERCQWNHQISKWKRRQMRKWSENKESYLKSLRSLWRKDNEIERVEQKWKSSSEHMEKKLTSIHEQMKQLQTMTPDESISLFENRMTNGNLKKHNVDLEFGNMLGKDRSDL